MSPHQTLPGQVLQLMPLAFGDLVELLEWNGVFRDIVTVENSERAGEKGCVRRAEGLRMGVGSPLHYPLLFWG